VRHRTLSIRLRYKIELRAVRRALIKLQLELDSW